MLPAIRIATLAVAASLAFCSPAFAHANLKASMPAANASVAAPQQLQLTFSEALNLRFSSVKLAGPGGTKIETGKAELTGGDKSLSIPVAGTLAPGVYTVDWNVLSVDGHKLKGSYSFTVAP